ncbi:hypothetical protein OAI83_00865 [Nitrosopumilus sp.]|nr:hypothetical protein [Nitrosopumilus sp.]
MLKNEKMNNLKSENSLHFPNVSTLMKLSLGLILFTIISTALVYAETNSEQIFVHFLENSNSQLTTPYLDNSFFSLDSGDSITIVNSDTVSHKFVSGVENSELQKSKNYDNFLICEFGEKIEPPTNKYSVDNICNFNKDNRISTDDILPGESVTVTITEVGNYRLIDPDYPWIELTVFSFPGSESSKNINSGFATVEKPSEQIPVEPKEVRPVNVIPAPLIQTISVDVNGILHDVEYYVQGMTVNAIESDTESMSLIFFVDVSDLNGIINVEFKRTFFDSVYDGIDDHFWALSDGEESVLEEIQTNSQSRSLTIGVPLGTDELEIIGSVFNNFVEEAVVEEAVVEEAVVEEAVVEEAVVETISNNECGPGTILENDVCVLDQRCGPGTILENDVCVLDSVPSTNNQSSSTNKEMIISFSIAFAIAGIVGIILALIAKAHKKKN